MADDWTEIDGLPDSFIEEDEKREIIGKVLKESLSEVQYQTLFLHYFSNMAVEDIAETMNCPEGTVKTRLKSARAKFKDALENYIDENKLVLGAAPFLTRFFTSSMSNITIPGTAVIPLPPAASVMPGMTGAAAGASSGVKAGIVSTLAGKIAIGAAALAGIAAIGIGGIVLLNNRKPDVTDTNDHTTDTTTAGSFDESVESESNGYASGSDPGDLQNTDLFEILDLSYNEYSNMEIPFMYDPNPYSGSDPYSNYDTDPVSLSFASEPDKIITKTIRVNGGYERSRDDETIYVNDGYVISNYSEIIVGYYNDANRAREVFTHSIDSLAPSGSDLLSLERASSDEYCLSGNTGHFLYSFSYDYEQISALVPNDGIEDPNSFEYSEGIYLAGNYVVIVHSSSFDGIQCGFVDDFCSRAGFTSPVGIVNSDAIKASELNIDLHDTFELFALAQVNESIYSAQNGWL